MYHGSLWKMHKHGHTWGRATGKRDEEARQEDPSTGHPQAEPQKFMQGGNMCKAACRHFETLLYVYECVASMYICVPYLCLTPEEAKTRHQIPWNYSYYVDAGNQTCVVWKRRTTEPSLLFFSLSFQKWAWLHTPVIPALKSLRQDWCEFQANLDYIIGPCLNPKSPKLNDQ